MKFDFINVISDGANTRYGSLFSSYEFYFKWNSTNGEDYNNATVLIRFTSLSVGCLHTGRS